MFDKDISWPTFFSLCLYYWKAIVNRVCVCVFIVLCYSTILSVFTSHTQKHQTRSQTSSFIDSVLYGCLRILQVIMMRIHSSWCCFKPVWASFFCWSQGNIFIFIHMWGWVNDDRVPISGWTIPLMSLNEGWFKRLETENTGVLLNLILLWDDGWSTEKSC